jgi:glycosyltransferase involved in cell wall biosynthesis
MDQSENRSQNRKINYRRDVPRLLKLIDLYVQASRSEGMPNALLEAMAVSYPVVATAVDGNRDLVEDGVHGWLVSADDPRSLAQAIQAALSEPLKAKRGAFAARQPVLTHFSMNAMIAEWESVLKGSPTAPLQKLDGARAGLFNKDLEKDASGS